MPVTLGSATQVITVAAPKSTSTTGSLIAWQKQADGTWTKAFGPVTAHLGRAGVGAQSEGSTKTPQGTFTLTQAFGINSNPGTGLPYLKVGNNDWWVSDTSAPTYNTHQVCAKASCPFKTSVSEHLAGVWQYAYAVVMDVNTGPVVPGKGSAFFLHVTDGGATAGCVAIDQSTLVAVMKWLQPGQHPRIAIGVG